MSLFALWLFYVFAPWWFQFQNVTLVHLKGGWCCSWSRGGWIKDKYVLGSLDNLKFHINNVLWNEYCYATVGRMWMQCNKIKDLKLKNNWKWHTKNLIGSDWERKTTKWICCLLLCNHANLWNKLKNLNKRHGSAAGRWCDAIPET